jgi:hypothetical protein
MAAPVVLGVQINPAVSACPELLDAGPTTPMFVDVPEEGWQFRRDVRVPVRYQQPPRQPWCDDFDFDVRPS